MSISFKVNGHNVNVASAFPCAVSIVNGEGKPEVRFTVPDCTDDSLAHILDRLDSLGDEVLKVTCLAKEFGSVKIQKKPSPVASELAKLLRTVSGSEVKIKAQAA